MALRDTSRPLPTTGQAPSLAGLCANLWTISTQCCIVTVNSMLGRSYGREFEILHQTNARVTANCVSHKSVPVCSNATSAGLPTVLDRWSIDINDSLRTQSCLHCWRKTKIAVAPCPAAGHVLAPLQALPSIPDGHYSDEFESEEGDVWAPQPQTSPLTPPPESRARNTGGFPTTPSTPTRSTRKRPIVDTASPRPNLSPSDARQEHVNKRARFNDSEAQQ